MSTTNNGLTPTRVGTVSMTPAQDFLLKVWIYFSVHTKLRAVVMVMMLCTLCSFVNQNSAIADSGGNAKTYFLPLEGVTDTHGVSVAKYTELPLDYGQGAYVRRIARGFAAGMLWSIYTIGVFVMLAAVKFILDFQWVDWVLAPFITLANSLQSVLGQANVMGLGIAVSALVMALTWAKGRYGTGVLQLVMVGLVAGLIATPMGNPSAHLKEWITTSSNYGKEIGTATVAAGDGENNLTDPVSGGIVDITLRNPALTMSFGSDFTGDGKCTSAFDDAAKADKDTEKIRKTVNKCSKAAKAANETDSATIFALFLLFWLSVVGLSLIIWVFVIFVLKDLIMAGLGGINVVLRAYLALFPGGARAEFFNAFFQVLVNVVMVAVYIWMLSGYLWLLKFMISDPRSADGMTLATAIIGLVAIVMGCSFFFAKSWAKKKARSIAEAVGSLGRGGQKARVEPTKFEQTMGRGFDRARAAGGRQASQKAAKAWAGRKAARATANAAAKKTAAGVFTAGAAATTAGVGLLAASALSRAKKATNLGAPGHNRLAQGKQTGIQAPQSPGAIPLGPTASDAAEDRKQAGQMQPRLSPVVPVHPDQQARAEQEGGRQVGDRDQVGAGGQARSRSGWALGTPVAGAPAMGLPPAPYGQTHVNTDSTVNHGFTGDGQIVKELPPNIKRAGEWDHSKGVDQDPVDITSWQATGKPGTPPAAGAGFTPRPQYGNATGPDVDRNPVPAAAPATSTGTAPLAPTQPPTSAQPTPQQGPGAQNSVPQGPGVPREAGRGRFSQAPASKPTAPPAPAPKVAGSQPAPAVNPTSRASDATDGPRQVRPSSSGFPKNKRG